MLTTRHPPKEIDRSAITDKVGKFLPASGEWFRLFGATPKDQQQPLQQLCRAARRSRSRPSLRSRAVRCRRCPVRPGPTRYIPHRSGVTT